MQKVTYSIIMPTLTRDNDHREVFRETVDSIVENSEDYELIIVDDGSTLKLDEYANPDVWVLHKDNKGIPASWNDGMMVARGEYIVIINDDITVPSGWLQGLRLALDNTISVAGPGVVGKTDQFMGIDQTHHWFPGFCFMMSRKTMMQIGRFDERFSPFNFEDTDYWVRVMKAGGTLNRNFNVRITHKEGDVLHKLEYSKVSEKNKQRFIEKHGFDPIPFFYHGGEKPW